MPQPKPYARQQKLSQIPMKTGKVALTGGIATGKSTVARMFAERGAVVLDADKVAREVVRPRTPSWRKLFDLLGGEYFEPDGELKRRELREAIIRDDGLRWKINGILHPTIIGAMEEEWARLRQADPEKPVIFDIPLLFEADLAHRFDVVILVYAPAEAQIERLMARDGLSDQEAAKTLTMQLPIESKKEKSDIVIDNSLDLARTQRQTQEVWEKLWG